MSDPRSPRVRSAEETILDLHAKIESDAKVIAALRDALEMSRTEMADYLIPFTEQEVADLAEAIDLAIEEYVFNSKRQRWAALYERLKSYND